MNGKIRWVAYSGLILICSGILLSLKIDSLFGFLIGAGIPLFCWGFHDWLIADFKEVLQKYSIHDGEKKE